MLVPLGCNLRLIRLTPRKYRSLREIVEESPSLPYLDLTDKPLPTPPYLDLQFFGNFDIGSGTTYRAAFSSVLYTASQECEGFCLIFNDDVFCLVNAAGFKLYHRLDSIIGDTFERYDELYRQFYLGRFG